MVRRLWLAVAVAAVGYVAWLIAAPGPGVAGRDLILYTLLLAGFATLVLLRGLTRTQDRGAWLLLSAGMVIWTWSDAWYTAVVIPSHQEFPTVADWGYLVFFPFAYVAVGLLVVGRVGSKAIGVWLDGLLVALAAGAFLSLMAPAISAGLGSESWVTFMAFATPVSDLLLVSGLAGIVGLLGRRTGSMWWALLVASGVLWATDSMWLLGIMSSEYHVGSLLDMGWLLAFAIFAAAAWCPVGSPVLVEEHAWSAVSVVAGAASFCLLIYGTQSHLPIVTVCLAAGAVVIGVWRGGQMLKDASAYHQAKLQANRDELTGVANRRSLTSRLGSGNLPSGALLLLDIDGFKQVNDSLGHAAGDHVLQEMARRLSDAVGPDVLVARLGGDEFAVFLRGTSDPSSAVGAAERLRIALAPPLPVNGLELRADVSIGVALAPEHGTTLDELLRAADSAMYHAKRSRSGTCLYEPEWDEADSDHLMCLQELRVALTEDRLACVYQPKLDLRSGEVVGVEALLRWHHPERGVLPPGWFLPLVERTALIRPLTLRVLDIALAQAAAWRAAGLDWTVSVNLSAMNLLDPGLAVTVGSLLGRHRVPADRLMLEVTEKVFVGDSDRARRVIGELTAMGVRLSVDDYGTGFSALNQIRMVATEELKLDTSFVCGVARRDDLASIVEATALLAHGLGLVLVAEGIEDQADLEAVTRLGCDLGQGFHICPPLPAADVEQWFRARVATVPVPRAATGATVARLPRYGDLGPEI
ncbi:MAG: EAL domain-containing protein [Candidatus Nanopelagicales bacterium]